MFRRLQQPSKNIALLLLAGLGGWQSLPAQALPDPTRPAHYRENFTAQQYRVESILFGVQRKIAVINGKAMAEGDQIGGLKVIKIDREYVRISTGGAVRDIALTRTQIRQDK